MEDTHTVNLTLPKHPQISLLTLFDGHSGREAADFMAQQICLMVDDIKDPINDHDALTAMMYTADSQFFGYIP